MFSLLVTFIINIYYVIIFKILTIYYFIKKTLVNSVFPFLYMPKSIILIINEIFRLNYTLYIKNDILKIYLMVRNVNLYFIMLE